LKKQKSVLKNDVGKPLEITIYTYILEEGDDVEDFLTYVRTIHPNAQIEISHKKAVVKYYKKIEEEKDE
jgi:hypothetical protein